MLVVLEGITSLEQSWNLPLAGLCLEPANHGGGHLCDNLYL